MVARGMRMSVLISILLSGIYAAEAASILIFVTPGMTSHLMSMNRLAQELTSRHHTVLVKCSFLYPLHTQLAHSMILV